MTELHPITPLLAADYRTVRLRALQDSPTSFGSTYRRESQLTDDEWLARAERLISGRGKGFLAFHDGRYVGIAVCFLDDDDPLKAQLISMWVAPEQRGLGVGKLLVDTIASWACEHGTRTLQLMVTSINHSAMEFYRSIGFSPTGRTKPYPNDPALEEYEMTKAL